MALCCMRTQLLQLRRLNLNLNQSLRSAPRVWDELGNMTQLTALCLDFYDKSVGAGCQLAACPCVSNRLDSVGSG